ncbi:UvrD-helicase domain-containing protein [Halobacillus salinarum]|uniref:UvrD-helicase domain-containing protein n=1 Tax=Halobacillus salinarum TaxID=2932257 RepID=A0ABY4EN72_9BACI|nr:RNA polymerase recycling motor HelD [Halobacillus salinarum]UOQ45907.1 UvrD-helicase domain-containing protein [Halobacillus salinarum]
MNKDHQIEQDYLNKVMSTIAHQIEEVEADTAKRKKTVVHIRKHFWDDLKVNMDTFDDYLETIIGLRQQAQDLSVSQTTHRHAYNRLGKLKRIEKSPFFGRIDFVEEGMNVSESVYVGVATVTDETNETILIHDWRAPISSIYYDYPPGPAEYTTPEGKIYGQLEKKWQYTISDGVIQSMFDTSLTIGDEILQQVLGKASNKHMQSIVATIQKEQNKIIRNVSGRLLIVQGAAGSGKTSAALQRIAYFLYKYREMLKADQIVLFSPNKMFSNYVSHVLPELGEENMQQETFQDYLEYRLDRFFTVEDPYDQLEYLLESVDDPNYETRKASIHFKASSSFFEGIKRYREILASAGMVFKGIKFRGQPLVTSQQMTDVFYNKDSALRFHNRIDKLKEWLLKEIDKTEKMEVEKDWVQEEIELLSKEELQKVYDQLEKTDKYSENSYEFYEKENKVLARMIVLKKLRPLRKKVKALAFIDSKQLYKQIFENGMSGKLWDEQELPEEWREISSMTRDMLDEEKLYHEDATPYLLLKELILGFQSNSSIKYVLIDEAQDYSVFQFEFIKRLFPSARMTVLGDFNQAIFAHANNVADFQSLTSLYGAEETERITLDRSYRSTREIIEFTRELVPEGEQIMAFDREGEKPILSRLSNQTELHREIRSKVVDLQNSGCETIAIICKSAAESLSAYQSLQTINDLKLVKKNTDDYEQGVVVIPAYLAKGIEFDAVIIYNAAEQIYGKESLRRLFYTACTRAMHHLYLYSVGEPNQFIRKISPGKLNNANNYHVDRKQSPGFMGG